MHIHVMQVAHSLIQLCSVLIFQYRPIYLYIYLFNIHLVHKVGYIKVKVKEKERKNQ